MAEQLNVQTTEQLDIINLAEPKRTPLDDIREGYKANEETAGAGGGKTLHDISAEYVAKKIADGEANDLPPFMLIAHGFEQLTENADADQQARRTARNERIAKQRAEQSNPFAVDYVSGRQL